MSEATEPPAGEPPVVAGPNEPPALRIVRGAPTPEELAVLTALVTAAAGGEVEPSAAPQRGRWSDPAAHHRRAWATGPGGWRCASR